MMSHNWLHDQNQMKDGINNEIVPAVIQLQTDV